MADMKVGQLYAKLGLDRKEFISLLNDSEVRFARAATSMQLAGERAAAQMNSGLARMAENLGSRMDAMAGRVVSAVKGIAMAGAATAVAGGAAGLKLAGDWEQAELAFTTMLGSAEKAKEFLEDLQSFAAATPFELPGLIKSTQKLLAFGFAANDIIPIMTAIGDAVSGLGGGAAEIDRVTIAIGQIRAKGKVAAQEMMQLAELGIPAWEMLAKAIGKSIPEAMKMAEMGAISAEVGINAVLSGMSERFSGLMDKQSKTLLGLWSTFKDTISMRLREIGDEMVKAFDLKKKLASVSEFIEKNGKLFISWAKTIFQAASYAWQGLQAFIGALFGVQAQTGGVIGVTNTMIQLLMQASKWWRDNAAKMAALLKVMAGIWVWTKLVPVFLGIAKAISVVTAALKAMSVAEAVAQGLAGNWPGIVAGLAAAGVAILAINKLTKSAEDAVKTASANAPKFTPVIPGVDSGAVSSAASATLPHISIPGGDSGASKDAAEAAKIRAELAIAKQKDEIRKLEMQRDAEMEGKGAETKKAIFDKYAYQIAQKREELAKKQAEINHEERQAYLEMLAVKYKAAGNTYLAEKQDAWNALYSERQALEEKAKAGENVFQRWSLALAQYNATLAEINKKQKEDWTATVRDAADKFVAAQKKIADYREEIYIKFIGFTQGEEAAKIAQIDRELKREKQRAKDIIENEKELQNYLKFLDAKAADDKSKVRNAGLEYEQGIYAKFVKLTQGETAAKLSQIEQERAKERQTAAEKIKDKDKLTAALAIIDASYNAERDDVLREEREKNAPKAPEYAWTDAMSAWQSNVIAGLNTGQPKPAVTAERQRERMVVALEYIAGQMRDGRKSINTADIANLLAPRYAY
jgi:tape measure domain-containing protein